MNRVVIGVVLWLCVLALAAWNPGRPVEPEPVYHEQGICDE